MRKRSLVVVLFLSGAVVLVAACGQDKPLSLASTPASVATVTRTPTPDPIITMIGMRAQVTPLPTPADQEVVLVSVEPGAGLPACAPKIGQAANLPDNFAPHFPLPDNIVISDVRVLNENPNYLQVIGYAPIALEMSIRFVTTALPGAGYALGTGDSEPNEMETMFSGNGYRGGLRVASLASCDRVTQWTVVTFKR